MTDETPQVIDARGHHCPVPTLRLQKAIEKALGGTTFRLLADDPMARIDVPHFASGAGHELISIEPVGEAFAFTVRKRA